MEVFNPYLLQIWALEDRLDVFLLYTEGTVLVRKQKLAGYGREQANLIFGWTIFRVLVFVSIWRKTQSFVMLGFFRFFFFFCWTMGVLLEYRNPKTNISPFSLLHSCKYDEFCSLSNVGIKYRCDTIGWTERELEWWSDLFLWYKTGFPRLFLAPHSQLSRTWKNRYLPILPGLFYIE